MLRLEIRTFSGQKERKKYIIKVVFFHVEKDVQNWDSKGRPFVHPS